MGFFITMSEHDLQTSCVKWFRLKYPKYRLLLFAVPNGAMLHGNRLQRVKQWNYLKSEGAVKGVSDLILLVAKGEFNGLCIEMKTNKKSSKQSKEQKDFEAAVINQGYAYVVPRSFEEFVSVVTQYLSNGDF